MTHETADALVLGPHLEAGTGSLDVGATFHAGRTARNDGKKEDTSNKMNKHIQPSYKSVYLDCLFLK
jgi:hypothetical protein